MSEFFNSSNILTLVGMLLAIIIAIWQYNEARKAKAELASILKSLPEEVVTSVQEYINQFRGQENELAGLDSSDFQLSTRYADLDGDGNDELLIALPYGVHGAQLKVFGFRDWDFKLITELEVSAPSEFFVKDINGDGRLEVTAIDIADTKFPYVCGFRDEVHYRLDGDDFVEIDRKPLYKPHELKQGHVDGDDS